MPPKIKNYHFETRLYIQVLFAIGIIQFLYSYISFKIYPKVEVVLIVPFILFILYTILSIYFYINQGKIWVRKQRINFVTIPLAILGVYNIFMAFKTNFHIDYLLGSFLIIFGGILLIGTRKFLIFHCLCFFFYHIILFCFFSYGYQTIISILTALFFIFLFSFFIQNSFIINRKLLKDAKYELEEQVKERTIDLENKIETIELINKNLEEYAHVVSHDLKAPLRNIDTLVNWVLEDNKKELRDDGLNSLNLVLSNVEKMDLLIKGILDYSSIDNLESEDRQIDFNTIVDEVLRTILIPKNIKITVQENLPIIYGNSLRFKQVFQNLIQNAIKYNNKENGTIEVGFLEKENHYEFFVKDNGMGINATYFDRIFKVFTKLESNNSSSGIGLSIVKKIVQFYKGEIWLESVLEKRHNILFHFT